MIGESRVGTGHAVARVLRRALSARRALVNLRRGRVAAVDVNKSLYRTRAEAARPLEASLDMSSAAPPLLHPLVLILRVVLLRPEGQTHERHKADHGGNAREDHASEHHVAWAW